MKRRRGRPRSGLPEHEQAVWDLINVDEGRRKPLGEELTDLYKIPIVVHLDQDPAKRNAEVDAIVGEWRRIRDQGHGG